MIESFFLNVLIVSALVGGVVLAVSLISPLTDRAFSPKWRYWLWIILAVRLLIPVHLTFGEAKLNVRVPNPVVSGEWTREETPTAEWSPPETSGGTASTTQPVSPAPTRQPSAASESGGGIPLLELGALLWLGGTAAFLVTETVTYMRFRRRILHDGITVRRGEPISLMLRRVQAELGIKTQVRAVVYRMAGSPMLLGFVRPILVLPEPDPGDEALYYILRHELTHLRQGDIWYKALMLLSNSFHWFNPLVWWMRRQSGRDLELCCDTGVISGADETARRAYSLTILSEARRQKRPNTPLSTHFHNGRRTLKVRFTNILTPKRRSGLAILLTVLLCGALVGGLVACGVSEAASPSSEAGSLPSETASPSSAVSGAVVTESAPVGTEITDPDELAALNQAYIQVWPASLFPFDTDFSADQPLTLSTSGSGSLFLSCWALSHRGEDPKWYDTLYGMAVDHGEGDIAQYEFSAELVEQTIQRYFDISSETLRSRTAAEYWEGYDAENDCYRFPLLPSADAAASVVTQAVENDGLLTIRAEFHDVENGQPAGKPLLIFEVTLQTSDDGSFRYIGNHTIYSYDGGMLPPASSMGFDYTREAGSYWFASWLNPAEPLGRAASGDSLLAWQAEEVRYLPASVFDPDTGYPLDLNLYADFTGPVTLKGTLCVLPSDTTMTENERLIFLPDGEVQGTLPVPLGEDAPTAFHPQFSEYDTAKALAEAIGEPTDVCLFGDAGEVPAYTNCEITIDRLVVWYGTANPHAGAVQNTGYLYCFYASDVRWTPRITLEAVPVMDADMQAYWDRYVRGTEWGLPLYEEWDEEHYFTDFNVYFMFLQAARLDGMDEIGGANDADSPDYPAALVESLISKYYLWDAAQIRASVPAYDTVPSTEAYIPSTDTYHFPGGYGGYTPPSVVTAARTEGKLLYLDCETYDDTRNETNAVVLIRRFTLTIRLDSEGGFQYLANHLTYIL